MSSFILVLFSSFCCLLDSFHRMRSERGAQSGKNKHLFSTRCKKLFIHHSQARNLLTFLPILNNFIPELEASLHWVHLISFHELSLLLQMWQQDSPWDLTKIKFNKNLDDYVRRPNNDNNNYCSTTVQELQVPSEAFCITSICFPNLSSWNERPISANLGLKFCSDFVFYLPMYCLQ